MSGVKRGVLAAVIAGVVVGEAFSSTTVDVLVAFDRSAAAWLSAAGREPAEFAEMAVGQMNAALAPTELDRDFTFRLAGAFQSAAEPSGDTPDVRLVDAIGSVCDGTRGRARGAWADIQSAREAFKADLVVVLIDSMRSGSMATGGVSWQMGGAGSAKPADFAKFAYAICGVEDVEGTQIVTHEVGHLMGAGHSDELEDDPGPQLDRYSSAWYACAADGRKYTTIMGYPYKTSSDFGYVTVPCFSSAVHMWDGLPLGDARHDNTRTLRETCATVARFRISGDESGDEPDGPVVPAVFAQKVTANGAVRDSGGQLVGIVQLSVSKTDKSGASKVSGQFVGLDGKKKSVKGVKVVPLAVDGVASVVDVDLAVKGAAVPLTVTIRCDGLVSGRFGDNEVGPVQSLGKSAGAIARFAVSGLPDEIGGFPVLNDVWSGETAFHLVPDGDGVGFDASAAKWRFAKAAGVKYVKDRQTKRPVLVVDTGKDGLKGNLCALKLSVSAKTGVFKGSFSVYAEAGTSEKPKLRKYKFTVTGLVVDGEGVGQAVCKKPALAVRVNIK